MSMLIFLQLLTALLWLSALALLWLLVLDVLEVNDGRVLVLLVFVVSALILTVVTAPRPLHNDKCPPSERQARYLGPESGQATEPAHPPPSPTSPVLDAYPAPATATATPTHEMQPTLPPTQPPASPVPPTPTAPVPGEYTPPASYP